MQVAGQQVCRIHRERRECERTDKKRCVTPSSSDGNSGILLITNDRPKNTGVYPMMFMIMGQLVRKLINPSLCFLKDKPADKSKISPNRVPNPRCLSTERSYDQNPKNSSFVFNRIPEEEFRKLTHRTHDLYDNSRLNSLSRRLGRWLSC